MGDVSSAENQTPTQGIEMPPKKSAGEVADEFLKQRELFKRYQERLSAETVAGNAADKIAEAGARRELEETRSNEVVSQSVPKKIQKPDISNAPTPPLPESISYSGEHKSFGQKIKASAGKMAWNTKLGITALAQLGALHPWKSEGKWVWVLEPWARTHDDPRQTGYSNGSDYYTNLFSKTDKRVIDMTSLGGENPVVTPDGTTGGIQLVNHRRIHEAQRQGKAIVVNVVNFHGAPKTFN